MKTELITTKQSWMRHEWRRQKRGWQLHEPPTQWPLTFRFKNWRFDTDQQTFQCQNNQQENHTPEINENSWRKLVTSGGKILYIFYSAAITTYWKYPRGGSPAGWRWTRLTNWSRKKLARKWKDVSLRPCPQLWRLWRYEPMEVRKSQFDLATKPKGTDAIIPHITDFSSVYTWRQAFWFMVEYDLAFPVLQS